MTITLTLEEITSYQAACERRYQMCYNRDIVAAAQAIAEAHPHHMNSATLDFLRDESKRLTEFLEQNPFPKLIPSV